MTTIEAAYQAARQHFSAVSDSAGLDAHMLLGAVLGVERAYLLAHPQQVLTEAQAAQFSQYVERHAAGEPIAYILGRRAFYDRDFIVTPAVLIPRPETELLLERALATVRRQPRAAVVDVGTGSGALAVTLAAHHPQALVYAIDISPAALAVARQNAALHGVTERIIFLEGDLLSPLLERGEQVDVVMANLPYIASAAVPTLAVSRYEPTLALDGGGDGLALVRRLLSALPQVLQPGGLALLEIGADQGDAALKLGRGCCPQVSSAVIHQDYAGLDRILELHFAEAGG